MTYEKQKTVKTTNDGQKDKDGTKQIKLCREKGFVRTMNQGNLTKRLHKENIFKAEVIRKK